MPSPPTVDVDLDFARYVSVRRGAADAAAREGAAYAYSGEHRVRRTLAYARPVTLALEATVRAWKGAARADLVRDAVRVTDREFPRTYAIAAKCASILRLPVPPVYVQAGLKGDAWTLGLDDDCYVVLDRDLVERLTDEELTFLLGHELGHLHNNHVVLNTALYYLTTGAAFYVKWIVQPATLPLRAWGRRAEVTCDRAGLLCTRDIDVAVRAIVKIAAGTSDVDVDAYLKEKGEGSRFLELFRRHPHLSKRIEALRLFSQSAFFRRHAGLGDDGLAAHDCDDEVAKLLSVF
jgi:Zn-dependent protease with chaperone function